MKKFYTILIILFQFLPGIGQIVTTSPSFPTEDKEVTITFDASLGTGGLKDFTGDVYAHTGVITDKSTSGSDWKYAPTWGDNSAKYKCTSLGNNKWQLNITPNIRDYYGVPADEKILQMAFVFRSADTSLEGKDDGGKDIFVDVSEGGLNVSIVSPTENKIIQKNEILDVTVNASGNDNLSLLLDGIQQNATTTQNITTTIQTAVAGKHELIAIATSGTTEARDTVHFFVREDVISASKPVGTIEGINYIDDTSVTLVMYAPNKNFAYVVGGFTNWAIDNAYQMKKDGDYFWITINNLTPGTEYVYQYIIDGDIKIADPYADKLLDPWNDQYISDTTYPDLIAYPSDKTSEIASVLQTGQGAFNWSDSQFTAPNKNDLVVYELHIRDFTAAGNIKTVTDTLAYLQRLGVNAIELMPFNEFEGNDSWGYNPSFYFAPDKAYGTKDDYKAFINECHKRGIAVLMDMVLNHSFGQSPFLRMYFDGTNPTADNPWYNQKSNFENPDAQWGYDFNHESAATQKLVDRINSYWMNEYHIDGFRFDFTKGFSNTPHSNSSDPWGGKRDTARIRLLERMSDEIWKVKSDAFVIFEHLSENTEEKELAAHGILLWGNANGNYNEATMGYNESNKSDLSWTSWKTRGWNAPQIVNYMESHDEERLMYKNLTYGNSAGDYDVTNLNTALSRMEAAAAFFFTVPGPKMIWQFGELGYDISIDENGRTGKKPIHWEYQDNANRKRVYDVFQALIKIKKEEAAFESTDFVLNTKTALKSIEINNSDMDVRIIGNFDVEAGTISPNYSKTGTWYDYFTGDAIEVTDVNASVTLAPGEYHIYTTKQLTTPDIASAPVASNVSVEGTFREDETVTATYTYSDVNGDLEGNSIYQWYRAEDANGTNETAISGANSLTYTLARADRGNFIRFAVTPVAQTGELLQGNTSYSAYSDEIAYSTGIDDINTSAEIKMYPNPVSASLHIDNIDGVKRIHIYNLTGKQIQVITPTNQNIQLDCSSLTTGIYLIVFDGENGTQFTKKLIKK